jgi:hypothetical protein
MSKPKHECMMLDCGEQGTIQVEDGKWMCVRHVTERVNSPENMAMTQAPASARGEKHTLGMEGL